jgi:Ca2+-binding RTX toxin-like protein
MLNRRLSVLIAAISLLMLVGSSADADTIPATTGPDNLFGTNRSDTINALAGQDNLFGRGRNDTLAGGDEPDTIFLGAGRDNVDAGSGIDFVVDDDGVSRRRERGEIINGGDNPDTISSADGERDTIDCGDGSDVVYADTNDVVKNCEAAYVFSGEVAAGFPFVAGTNRSDNIFLGGPSIVFGKGGNDTITGDTSIDHLYGGSGRDTLNGGGNEDRLYDDDGKPGDRLNGGAAFDRIYSIDGARDQIDCGLADGAVDIVYADAEDTLVNCVPTDTVIRANDL